MRDLEQISRNSYILVGVIEILRQNDVYLITTECDLNAELINSGLERFVGDRFVRQAPYDVRLHLWINSEVHLKEYKVWAVRHRPACKTGTEATSDRPEIRHRILNGEELLNAVTDRSAATLYRILDFPRYYGGTDYGRKPIYNMNSI